MLDGLHVVAFVRGPWFLFVQIRDGIQIVKSFNCFYRVTTQTNGLFLLETKKTEVHVMFVAEQVFYLYKIVGETVRHDLVIVSSGVHDVLEFARLTHQSALASQTLEPGCSLGSRKCGNTHLAQREVLYQLHLGLPLRQFLSFHV